MSPPTDYPIPHHTSSAYFTIMQLEQSVLNILYLACKDLQIGFNTNNNLIFSFPILATFRLVLNKTYFTMLVVEANKHLLHLYSSFTFDRCKKRRIQWGYILQEALFSVGQLLGAQTPTRALLAGYSSKIARKLIVLLHSRNLARHSLQACDLAGNVDPNRNTEAEQRGRLKLFTSSFCFAGTSGIKRI